MSKKRAATESSESSKSSKSSKSSESSEFSESSVSLPVLLDIDPDSYDVVIHTGRGVIKADSDNMKKLSPNIWSKVFNSTDKDKNGIYHLYHYGKSDINYMIKFLLESYPKDVGYKYHHIYDEILNPAKYLHYILPHGNEKLNNIILKLILERMRESFDTNKLFPYIDCIILLTNVYDTQLINRNSIYPYVLYLIKSIILGVDIDVPDYPISDKLRKILLSFTVQPVISYRIENVLGYDPMTDEKVKSEQLIQTISNRIKIHNSKIYK